jgi:hypothetical protein
LPKVPLLPSHLHWTTQPRRFTPDLDGFMIAIITFGSFDRDKLNARNPAWC